MMRLHIIPDHFYKFYSIGDVIKGLIMLIIFHIVLAPFIALAVQLIIYGPSFVLAFFVSGISLINVGYFIKAVIEFVIYTKKMRFLKAHNLLPDPNIDIIWQVKNPF